MNDRGAGFTYIELLVAVSLASLILLGLGALVGQALNAREQLQTRIHLQQEADFAMQAMTRAIAQSHRLILPLADNPATDWPENLRRQQFPAAAPSGSSSFDSAVLAVALPRNIDRDRDGVFDADNDGDGRFDEDGGNDLGNDGASGVAGIDDNGDGGIDTAGIGDDDEDGVADDEIDNRVDDDDDGSIDEDLPADRNNDGCPGLCGVDDDGDGLIDEGQPEDDDEDGSIDEDWLDVVVFRLDDGRLIERIPAPWDENNDGRIDGLDATESVIAESVRQLRVERLPAMPGQAPVIELQLELIAPSGTGQVSVTTRLRVGAAL